MSTNNNTFHEIYLNNKKQNQSEEEEEIEENKKEDEISEGETVFLSNNLKQRLIFTRKNKEKLSFISQIHGQNQNDLMYKINQGSFLYKNILLVIYLVFQVFNLPFYRIVLDNLSSNLEMSLTSTRNETITDNNLHKIYYSNKLLYEYIIYTYRSQLIFLILLSYILLFNILLRIFKINKNFLVSKIHFISSFSLIIDLSYIRSQSSTVKSVLFYISQIFMSIGMIITTNSVTIPLVLLVFLYKNVVFESFLCVFRRRNEEEKTEKSEKIMKNIILIVAFFISIVLYCYYNQSSTSYTLLCIVILFICVIVNCGVDSYLKKQIANEPNKDNEDKERNIDKINIVDNQHYNIRLILSPQTRYTNYIDDNNNINQDSSNTLFQSPIIILLRISFGICLFNFFLYFLLVFSYFYNENTVSISKIASESIIFNVNPIRSNLYMYFSCIISIFSSFFMIIINMIDLKSINYQYKFEILKFSQVFFIYILLYLLHSLYNDNQYINLIILIILCLLFLYVRFDEIDEEE